MRALNLLVTSGILFLGLTATAGDYSFGYKPGGSGKAIRTQVNKTLNAASNPGKADHYSWDGVSAWDFNFKSIYTYNMDGLLLEEIRQNDLNENTGRSMSTYDSEGRELTYKVQNYYAGQWEDANLYEMQYDSYGHILSYTGKVWNGSSWDTTYAERYQYVLNPSGFITEQVVQSYDLTTHDWANEYKGTFTLDGNGWPVEGIFSQWTGVTWTEVQRYSDIVWHNYDPETVDGAFSYYLYQEWNGLAWDTLGRENYTYDAYEGYVAVGEMYNAGTWSNFFRDTEVRDSRFNPVSYSYEEWNSTDMVWEMSFQSAEDLTYDGNDNITERITKYWNSSNPQWMNDQRDVYSDFGAGLAQLFKGELKLSPNPVRDWLTLDLSAQETDKVVIFNQLGQEISFFEITGERMHIDLSGLAPGMYIINTTGAKGIFSGKFIKE